MHKAQFAHSVTGSCLCKAVVFEMNIPRNIVNCHCGMCRKFHGNYAAYTQSSKHDMRIDGAHNIKWYLSEEGRAKRGFCIVCGSSLFWEPVGGDSICVAAGALDSPCKLHTIKNIYTNDAGDYYIVDTDAEMYTGTMKNARPINDGAAGKHLIAEIEGTEIDYDEIELGLIELSKLVKGNILYRCFHRFPQAGALTGVIILSEAHISIHTLPERKYAAVDVFMYKMFDTESVKNLLWEVFRPSKISIKEMLRCVAS